MQALAGHAATMDLADFLAASFSDAGTHWFGASVWEALLEEGRDAMKAALCRDIAEIDAILTAQIKAILHHPRFQRLEASWRGLRYLVDQLEDGDNILIRVLNVTWNELARDFERSIEFDQSQLFAKVYSEEFGMPGGKPYGVLLCDYQVQLARTKDRPTDDIGTLDALSRVAAAAFAPAVASCSPGMLGMADFNELAYPGWADELAKVPGFARWQRLQDSEDARFLGLVLPRVLMRFPRGREVVPGFLYDELSGGMMPGAYLWGSPIYALGGVLIRAFRDYGWFADIYGTPDAGNAGGLVTDIAFPAMPSDPFSRRPPVEMVISEEVEKQLAELGLMALCPSRLTESCAFLTPASVKRPQEGYSSGATANARLSSMLHYMLCVSRFSHYIKVIARDRVGSVTSPGELESMLQQWLLKYQLANDDASSELKARYPLRDAQVQIAPAAGKPGIYNCVIHLQPHFQLEQIVSSFRLATELVAAEFGR